MVAKARRVAFTAAVLLLLALVVTADDMQARAGVFETVPSPNVNFSLYVMYIYIKS